MQKTDADGEPINTKKPANNENTSRGDFIVRLVAYKIPKSKFLINIPNPGEHMEILQAMVRGAALDKIAPQLAKSSEAEVDVLVEPEKMMYWRSSPRNLLYLLAEILELARSPSVTLRIVHES